MALRRLGRELADALICGAPMDDIFSWKMIVAPLPGSIYDVADGGITVWSIRFPPDYPFKPYKLALRSPLVHPAISAIPSDSEAPVQYRVGCCYSLGCCSPSFRDMWSPRLTIREAGNSAAQLLDEWADPEKVSSNQALKAMAQSAPTQFVELATRWALTSTLTTPDGDGDTPLGLVERWAAVDGVTALAFVVRCDNLPLLRRLLSHYRKTGTLSEHINALTVRKPQRTPLMMVRSVTACLELIGAGALPNAQSPTDGETLFSLLVTPPVGARPVLDSHERIQMLRKLQELLPMASPAPSLYQVCLHRLRQHPDKLAELLQRPRLPPALQHDLEVPHMCVDLRLPVNARAMEAFVSEMAAVAAAANRDTPVTA